VQRYVIIDSDDLYIGSLSYEPYEGSILDSDRHGLSVNEANRVEDAYVFTDWELASIIASLWGGSVVELPNEEDS